MDWVLKLSIFTLLIQLNVAVYIIPETIYTESNGSYTAMIVDDNENIKPKKCYLRDLKTTYDVDLETSGVQLVPGNTTTNILTSLGNGICGFKLENFDENNYIRNWNISFYDQNDTYYHQVVTVVLYGVKIENETVIAKMGKPFDINCGLSIEYLLSCSLYDPLGRLVMSSDTYRNVCVHTEIISKKFHFGQWKCVLNLKSNMSPRNIYYNVVEDDKRVVHLWKNETYMHVNIGCYIDKSYSTSKIRLCEMLRPDGEIFTFREGFATDRYTALSTRLSKGICGIEIKKPLENYDKGLWRCALKDIMLGDYQYPTGGFINLTDESSTLPPPEPEIPEEIVVLENKDVSITCKVPYSSPYCYMRGPNGMYPIENSQETLLGICKFNYQNARLSDTGKWSCGFAKENSEADEVFKFKIFVLNNYDVMPERDHVYAKAGSTVQLQCHTIGNYPIQYCRFQDNYNQTYHIDPSPSEEMIANGISYYGRGLKYGECGIEKEVTISDSRYWTCITRVGDDFDYPEVYSRIEVTVRK